MNELHAQAQALADKTRLEEADFVTLGRVLRAENRDDEDPSTDVDAWAALRARVEAFPAVAAKPAVPLPKTPALDAFAATLGGDVAAVVADAERLGAAALAEAFLHGSGDVGAVARSFGVAIASKGREHAIDLFPYAEAALRAVCANGAHPDGDHVLLALSDVVGHRLEAALRGEPLLGRKKASFTAESAAALSAVLAQAFGRASLELVGTPTLLPAPSVRGQDLVLHDAGLAAPPRSLVEARGVSVKLVGREIVVRFDGPRPETVMLVSIVYGEPDAYLSPRGGADDRELVFELVDDEVDGYALVVGDRVLFLRAS